MYGVVWEIGQLTFNYLVIPTEILEDVKNIWNLSVDFENLLAGRRTSGWKDASPAGEFLETCQGVEVIAVIAVNDTEFLRFNLGVGHDCSLFGSHMGGKERI